MPRSARREGAAEAVEQPAEQNGRFLDGCCRPRQFGEPLEHAAIVGRDRLCLEVGALGIGQLVERSERIACGDATLERHVAGELGGVFEHRLEQRRGFRKVLLLDRQVTKSQGRFEVFRVELAGALERISSQCLVFQRVQAELTQGHQTCSARRGILGELHLAQQQLGLAARISTTFIQATRALRAQARCRASDSSANV